MGTLCFDLDGTLCSNTDGDYEAAEPCTWAIRRVAALSRAGHRIIVLTARGSATGIDWEPLTRAQLERWGVPYDELHFGKPSADVYVDDRAVHADGWRTGDAVRVPGFEAESTLGVDRPAVPAVPVSAVAEVGRTYGGRARRLEHHAARVRALAKLAGIPAPPTPAQIVPAVREAVEAAQSGDVVYAITVAPTAHLAHLEGLGAGPIAPVRVACRPLAEAFAGLAPLLDDAAGGAAIRATLTGAPGAWPLGLGCDGGVFDTLGGQLGVVSGGAVVLEPSRGFPSVAGGWLEDLTAAAGLELHERPVTLPMLEQADEAFVTGLPFCLLPVAALDGRALPGGAPGPVTAMLLETWGGDVGVDLPAERAALVEPEPAAVR